MAKALLFQAVTVLVTLCPRRYCSGVDQISPMLLRGPVLPASCIPKGGLVVSLFAAGFLPFLPFWDLREGDEDLGLLYSP